MQIFVKRQLVLTGTVTNLFLKKVLAFCLTSRSKHFSQIGMEPALPGYLPVLWEPLSVLLKDTIRQSLGSYPGPLAPELSNWESVKIINASEKRFIF